MLKAGFTLFELLVCLFLLALVLLFSVPLTATWYKRNQIQTLSSSVKNAIQMAKTQALITGNTLILSHLSEDKDWSKGMLLFVDNAQHKYTPTSKLLYEWHWQQPGIHIEWHGFQSSEYLLFASNLSHSAANGYFMISNGDQQVKLIVNRLGRAN